MTDAPRSDRPGPLVDPTRALERDELSRYARHILLSEVGEEGQRRLRAARVLIVGAGGLGSPSALYLAAAGIGTLGLVDDDRVDPTNLQRQILHRTEDVGRPKLASATERIREVNPGVTVERHDTRLDSNNALEILEGYDVIVDGTDNFPTRYLVNDACVLLGLPNVYASVLRFDGQASVFWGTHGPCYRCLFREPPPPGLVPSCAEGGVLGALPGILGSIQAMETVKLLLGIGEPLIGRLLLFDALEMSGREMKLRKDPECPVCSENPTQTELIDYELFCGVPAEEGAAPATSDPDSDFETDPHAPVGARELADRMDRGAGPEQLVDVRRPEEWTIANLGDRGARLLSLERIEEWIPELDPDAPTVVYCRSGARSARVAARLRAEGFRSVRNLTGGILAWAREVDPEMPTY